MATSTQNLAAIWSCGNLSLVVRSRVELDNLSACLEWMGIADSPKITSCENVCCCENDILIKTFVIIKNCFCVYHKNRQKHSKHLELLFFLDKFTLCLIKLSIHRKINLPLINLFGLLLSGHPEKTCTD